MDDDPEADLLSILPITNVFIECASRVGKVFVHWLAFFLWSYI